MLLKSSSVKKFNELWPDRSQNKKKQAGLFRPAFCCVIGHNFLTGSTGYPTKLLSSTRTTTFPSANWLTKRPCTEIQVPTEIVRNIYRFPPKAVASSINSRGSIKIYQDFDISDRATCNFLSSTAVSEGDGRYRSLCQQVLGGAADMLVSKGSYSQSRKTGISGKSAGGIG